MRLSALAAVAVMVWATGRALDVQHAQAHTSRSVIAIQQVFGPRAPAALRVARCESRLNPRAVGRAGERGLFQLHPIHRGWIDRLYGWHRMFEPIVNARAAYRLSRGGTSWRHWTCKP